MTFIRHCSRPGCTRPAIATLEFNYSQQKAIVGPLQVAGNPHRWDLCDFHAQRTTVPQGWQLEYHHDNLYTTLATGTHTTSAHSHRSSQTIIDDADDDADLMALALAVRQAQEYSDTENTITHDHNQTIVVRRAEIPQPTGRHPSRKNLPNTRCSQRHLRAVPNSLHSEMTTE